SAATKTPAATTRRTEPASSSQAVSTGSHPSGRRTTVRGDCQSRPWAVRGPSDSGALSRNSTHSRAVPEPAVPVRRGPLGRAVHRDGPPAAQSEPGGRVHREGRQGDDGEQVGVAQGDAELLGETLGESVATNGVGRPARGQAVV